MFHLICTININTSMIKLFFFSLFLIPVLAVTAQKTGWSKDQLMKPLELAMNLKSEKDIPIIICVGPGANIPHSIDVGTTKDDTNIEKLKTQLSNLPKDMKVVVYCGCCPFEYCPNVKPAMDVLKALSFTNYFLLDLPNNLKKDWIDKGYPTVK